ASFGNLSLDSHGKAASRQIRPLRACTEGPSARAGARRVPGLVPTSTAFGLLSCGSAKTVERDRTTSGGQNMRTTITTVLGLAAATWLAQVHADVTVMAVRLGAKDVVALAKFYDAAFGLKQIDSVGQPPTEIIMRFGATAAAAKA